MEENNLKGLFFEQVARIAKALSNPKRLEIMELLCQGEKSVDLISQQTGINIKLASSHLQDLKDASLVESRKEGKFVIYRVAGDSVVLFYTHLKNLAESRLINNRNVLSDYLNSPDDSLPMDKKELMRKARSGEVVVIDLRPRDEFKAGHLPYARSVPINELEARIKSLPKEKEIVAYCRGSSCVWSHEALEVLKINGFKAYRLKDGVADWLSAGMRLEV